MWKEHFRTGVDIIDDQHKELFDKTGVLLRGVNDSVENNRDLCISTIQFLKDYAISHFAYEEKLLQSVEYADFAEHKTQHEKFLQSVMNYEQKMIETDFGAKYVREFTGMLATWLIYHVADVDVRYVEYMRGVEHSTRAAARSHKDMVRNGVVTTLNMMAGLEEQSFAFVDIYDADGGDYVSVEVGLTGDISGYIAYVYPVPFIKNLIYALMSYTPDDIGDMELSALFELTNIISGNICNQMSKAESKLCDIKPPSIADMSIIEPDEKFYLDTGIGVIETDLVVEYLAA